MTVPDYVDLEVYKAWKDIDATDTTHDAVISRRITAASRIVDRYCRRQPGEFAGITATKVFDVMAGHRPVLPTYEQQLIWGSPQRLWIPPLLTLTSLKTDSTGDGTYDTTWASTDYILYPLNDSPKIEVQLDLQNGQYTFPVGQRRVQIVGVWGEQLDPPAPIQEATMILANRLDNRAGSPEGIFGSAEFGFVSLNELDPDVVMILRLGGYYNPKVFH